MSIAVFCNVNGTCFSYVIHESKSMTKTHSFCSFCIAILQELCVCIGNEGYTDFSTWRMSVCLIGRIYNGVLEIIFKASINFLFPNLSYSPSMRLIYPRRQWNWRRGILVSPCPSACGQNSFRAVLFTILAGYILYLHSLATNFSRCVAYWDFFNSSRIFLLRDCADYDVLASFVCLAKSFNV